MKSQPVIAPSAMNRMLMRATTTLTPNPLATIAAWEVRKAAEKAAAERPPA